MNVNISNSKQLTIICILAVILFLSGCAPEISNRISNANDVFPELFPRKVVIMQFHGDKRIANFTERHFTDRVKELGFQAVTSEEFLREIANIEELNKELSPARVLKAMNDLGYDGYFLGEVGIKSGLRTVVILDLKLISIKSKSELWTARVSGPAWYSLNTDPEVSVNYAVNKITKLLKRDLVQQIRRERDFMR